MDNFCWQGAGVELRLCGCRELVPESVPTPVSVLVFINISIKLFLFVVTGVGTGLWRRESVQGDGVP